MALFDNIASGAAGGTALGPWGAVAGGVLGALPTLAQLFTGSAQRRRASAINPVDPGFQVNQGILDNQKIVNDRFNNFGLPGKSAIENQIQGSYATGVGDIERAATNSGDVLAGVTNLNFNKDTNLMNLGIQEAEMKQGMLPMVLDANAAAGNQAVLRNAQQEQRYQEDLARKAGLEQAGAINQFKAVDNLATLGGSLLNYRAEPWSRDSSFKRRSNY